MYFQNPMERGRGKMGKKTADMRIIPCGIENIWIMGGNLTVFIIGKPAGKVAITFKEPRRLIDYICMADKNLGGSNGYPHDLNYPYNEFFNWKLVHYNGQKKKVIVRRVKHKKMPSQQFFDQRIG